LERAVGNVWVRLRSPGMALEAPTITSVGDKPKRRVINVTSTGKPMVPRLKKEFAKLSAAEGITG